MNDITLLNMLIIIIPIIGILLIIIISFLVTKSTNKYLSKFKVGDVVYKVPDIYDTYIVTEVIYGNDELYHYKVKKCNIEGCRIDDYEFIIVPGFYEYSGEHIELHDINKLHS